MKIKKWTKEYEKIYSKKYREEHKERARELNIKWREKNKEYINLTKKKERANLKKVVIKHYNPNSCCEICGFNDIRALQIDHVNNNGAEERRKLFGNRLYAGTTFYRWLRKNNYPTGYQILCANCNTIKFQKTL